MLRDETLAGRAKASGVLFLEKQTSMASRGLGLTQRAASLGNPEGTWHQGLVSQTHAPFLPMSAVLCVCSLLLMLLEEAVPAASPSRAGRVASHVLRDPRALRGGRRGPPALLRVHRVRPLPLSRQPPLFHLPSVLGPQRRLVNLRGVHKGKWK